MASFRSSLPSLTWQIAAKSTLVRCRLISCLLLATFLRIVSSLSIWLQKNAGRSKQSCATGKAKNKLPEEKVVEVNLKDQEGLLPQEQFDLTQFCTSEEHAIKVAKYFLGIRDLVSHTITFSTTVHGLNLRAGSYIKVATTVTPYSNANNGTVSSTGAVTSVEELADGRYDVTFFKTGSEDVEDGEMQVSGGQVADSTFHDSVFTLRNEKVSQNVYIVEQLTFSEEGTVDIVASEHPCDDDGVSELAKLVAGDSVLRFVPDGFSYAATYWSHLRPWQLSRQDF